MVLRDWAAVRCRAPKTASGIAKHKLLRATTLSRPRAWARSVLATHNPITKSRTPALYIETGTREISRKISAGKGGAIVGRMFSF